MDSLDEVVHGGLGVAGHIHQSLQMLSLPDGKDHLGICNSIRLAAFQSDSKSALRRFLGLTQACSRRIHDGGDFRRHDGIEDVGEYVFGFSAVKLNIGQTFKRTHL